MTFGEVGAKPQVACQHLADNVRSKDFQVLSVALEPEGCRVDIVFDALVQQFATGDRAMRGWRMHGDLDMT